MSIDLFIKPYDIFMPRGNSHFGVNSGDFGRIKMLPFPSIFAGAIRSQIASRNSKVFDCVRAGQAPELEPYKSVLGSVKQPGSFKIENVVLCKQTKSGVEPIFSVPTDLVLFEDNGNITDIVRLIPKKRSNIIELANALPKIAVLQAPTKKPAGGYYLSKSGYEKYLKGSELKREDFIKEKELWKKEMRTGVALSTLTRAAEEGMLYTAEALSFTENVGFAVKVGGADPLLKGVCGDLSLGGDQRAASFKAESAGIEIPEYEYEKIKQNKKFKLLLTAPAIFEKGWLPNRVNDEFWLEYRGFKAKLVCAAVGGYETISGWNMVENRPKTAMKCVPAGSVYWFEEVDGSLDSLKELVDFGFWNEGYDEQRLVEGYNRVALAAF